MNLNGTLHLEHVEEAKLADLAGALIKEPGAVNWNHVTDYLLDDLGDCACRSLALLALGIARLGPETRTTIFRAVINASSTDEIWVDGEYNEDLGHDIRSIDIHNIHFGIGDLTDRGCDEVIEWGRKNREAA